MVQLPKGRACWASQNLVRLFKGSQPWFFLHYYSQFLCRSQRALSSFSVLEKLCIMDGDGRHRRPRRIPAPEAPGGSRRSKRLREPVPVAGPAPRILVSDSESVNRPSGFAAGGDDGDPFFIPGVAPGPSEEEGAAGPLHSAEGAPGPVEPGRAAGEDQGLPTPGAEYPFSEAGPSRERRTPREARSHYFREGIRLGRLENRVACVRAEIRRLERQLGPMLEKLHRRRMRMGDEFGLDAYVAGGFSTDED
jgi:hypothetical protein